MKKILVVDDDDFMRNWVVNFLLHQFPKAEILEAQNGLEAKSKLEECPAGALPNAVFTDFEMPGMNGWGLIQFIRKSLVPNSLPVVMISGLAGEAANLLRANVKSLNGYFLEKPFGQEDFRRIISDVWPARERKT